MFKRIVALTLIFVVTSISWFILGGNMASRSSERYKKMDGALAGLWGEPQRQQAPWSALIRYENRKACSTDAKTQKEECSVTSEKVYDPFDPDSSDIKVNLELDQRRKGLFWFSLYTAKFDSTYTLTNPKNTEQDVEVYFYFPNKMALYDDLLVKVEGKPEASIKSIDSSNANQTGGMVAGFKMAPNEKVTMRFAYKSRGLDDWAYSFGESVKMVKNFKLTMTTDFAKIDFPANSISPDSKQQSGKGWQLVWDKKSLVSGFNVGMVMPTRINPGPLAEQMSFFAPVSLLFFFFVIFIITIIKNVKIHPMNFFFLAAAFFSFHILFAYLVDHISIYWAFGISSAVSIFLVVSYLRLVAGLRFAVVEAGVSQFLYLIVFSFAHFFKGYTGLIITILSIVTLFVVMQLTGRIDWETQFKGKPAA
jgi:inner membrane protein involved in colicin E2 resistance